MGKRKESDCRFRFNSGRRWGPLVRQERVRPVVEHFGSQVLEKGQGLLVVQISHHCVTFPSCQQFDNIRVAIAL